METNMNFWSMETLGPKESSFSDCSYDERSGRRPALVTLECNEWHNQFQVFKFIF